MTSVKVRSNHALSQLPIMGLARSLRVTIRRLRLVGAMAEYYDGIVMYGEGRFDLHAHVLTVVYDCGYNEAVWKNITRIR